jgi:hypothetical protein
MRALGFSPSVHAWIMSSLKTTAQGVAFAFDLNGMYASTWSLGKAVRLSPALCSILIAYRRRRDVCRLLPRRFVARCWCVAASSPALQCAPPQAFCLLAESPPASSTIAFVRAENGGLPLHSSMQRLDKALGNRLVTLYDLAARRVAPTQLSGAISWATVGIGFTSTTQTVQRAASPRHRPANSRHQDFLQYCDQV